jgi:hypothetical protein
VDHPVSLWRKRNNVQHNEQNQPKWFNMTALANNDLSIKSEDLSIKLWVGLTDEEIGMAFRAVFPVGGIVFTNGATEFAQTIERKLKEKNA